MKKLKIALGATLHKRVHKESSGGTEVFAYYLAKGLVEKGHEVTMFASGDSEVVGNLKGISSELEINRVEQGQKLFLGYQLLESKLIFEHQEEFDIIHINYFEPYLFTPFSIFIKKPVIYTIHSDLLVSSSWQIVLNEMVKPDDIFVFVSKVASEWATKLKNKRFIYNGIDTSIFPFSATHRNYLLWLGRIRKKKGIKEAVEVAIKSGEKLIISGVIDNPEEKLFFETEVKSLIEGNKNIEFIGPVRHKEKVNLYQGAKAFLFPISWEEPFGLTMIEALSCGTPVIAFKRGAVLEIIEDGKTGFIVNDVDTMVEKLQLIDKLKRQDCRKMAEEKFSLTKMVDNYEALYYKIASR